MKSVRCVGLAETDWAKLASEFITETHRGLPMLWVYFPFRDPALEEGRDVLRWPQYVPVEELSASVDWFGATGSIFETDPSIWDLVG